MLEFTSVQLTSYVSLCICLSICLSLFPEWTKYVYLFKILIESDKFDPKFFLPQKPRRIWHPNRIFHTQCSVQITCNHFRPLTPNYWPCILWVCKLPLPGDNFGTVVGEDLTPFVILASWAVNGLSIVCWPCLHLLTSHVPQTTGTTYNMAIEHITGLASAISISSSDVIYIHVHMANNWTQSIILKRHHLLPT